MTGRRILYIFAMAGCLLFYGAYQKWFSWIVLLAMLLLPWFSLLLSLWPMIGTKGKITAPEKTIRGDKAAVQLKIQCPGVCPPIHCRIRVTKPITGEKWILTSGDCLPTDQCGGLIIEPMRVMVYEYLCLLGWKLRKIPGCVVRILPEPKEMPIPSDLSRYLAHGWRPKQGGGYAENHEIRSYYPGDTLNLVHWKLSVKMDELMLREPMEPEHGLILLTMDVNGSSAELDRKFGRLLWMCQWLLRQQVVFGVIALTGNGIESWSVETERELNQCIDDLLCVPFAGNDSLQERRFSAAWRAHIGGEPDEK